MNQCEQVEYYGIASTVFSRCSSNNTDICSFLCVSGQRGTIAKSTFEQHHLCVIALTSIERGTQLFRLPLTSLCDLLLLFVYFQVNNGVLYVLDYVEDIYIMVYLFSFNVVVTSASQHIYLCNSILVLTCLMMYYFVFAVFLGFFLCPCMAINVSLQYNGGLFPDILVLTQCYYHNRGTRLNAMKRFCICSL